MEYLWYFLALIVWSTIIALIEIQIEGQHGWAKNFPTTRWQKKNNTFLKLPFGEHTWLPIKASLFIKFTLKILGRRDLTGYHLYGILMQFFVASFVTYSFFAGQGLLAVICRVFSFVWFVMAIEDTIWFALNPHYRLKNYRQDTINWHAQDWWHFAPKGMIIAMLLAIIAFIIPFFL